MVALPVSGTEPSLLNVTNIRSNGSENYDESRSAEIIRQRIMDRAFVIPRVTMSPNNGNDNYALEFDRIDKSDKKNFNVTGDGIKAEPVVLKKVAGEINTAFLFILSSSFFPLLLINIGNVYIKRTRDIFISCICIFF